MSKVIRTLPQVIQEVQKITFERPSGKGFDAANVPFDDMMAKVKVVLDENDIVLNFRFDPQLLLWKARLVKITEIDKDKANLDTVYLDNSFLPKGSDSNVEKGVTSDITLMKKNFLITYFNLFTVYVKEDKNVTVKDKSNPTNDLGKRLEETMKKGDI